jgi:hypothetical protein
MKIKDLKKQIDMLKDRAYNRQLKTTTKYGEPTILSLKADIDALFQLNSILFQYITETQQANPSANKEGGND